MEERIHFHEGALQLLDKVLDKVYKILLVIVFSLFAIELMGHWMVVAALATLAILAIWNLQIDPGTGKSHGLFYYYVILATWDIFLVTIDVVLLDGPGILSAVTLCGCISLLAYDCRLWIKRKRKALY